MLAGAGRKSTQLGLGADASSASGKSRPEHVSDQTQRPFLAHRAGSARRLRAVLGDAHELGLRVADVGSSQITLAKGAQGSTAIEPEVDGPGRARRGAAALWLHELHRIRVAISSARDGPTGLGRTADRWRTASSLYRIDSCTRYIALARVRAVLETAVLGLLVDNDLHGYELKKRLTELLGTWSSVSFGSLYPALARLEKAGLVYTVESSAAAAPMSGSLGAEVAAYRARARQTPSSRRARKVYGVTEAGRRRLGVLLDNHTGDDRSFAVRVAVCRHLSDGSRLELFRRRRSDLTARLHAESAASGERGDLYRRSLVEFQHERLLREQAWLDRLIEAELTPPPSSSTIPLHGGTPS